MVTTNALAAAPTVTGSGDIAELNVAYQELLNALGGDQETLDKRVSDRCRVIGPKGFSIGKAEWIDAHDGKLYEQVALETLDSDVLIIGTTAVRADLQSSECLFQGQLITGLFRVLSVWSHEDIGWQLVAIQYTAVAPEAAPGHEQQ